MWTLVVGKTSHNTNATELTPIDKSVSIEMGEVRLYNTSVMELLRMC